jgi:serine/threonine-protein kinase
MLPNRRGLLLNVFHEADVNVPSEGDIVVQSLGGNERKLIVDRGTHPVYLSSGHIIFARNGDLWAVPFDVMGLEATGAPAVVLEDVMLAESGPNSTLNSGAAQFSVSATGTLAFVPGGIYPGQRHSLVWLDVAGEPEELLLEPDRYLWPRFSPDGTRLVYAVGSFGDFRLWVYDVALAVAQPLTPQAAGEHWAPVWSPGGERIVFGRVGAGADAGLYLTADGSEQIEQLAAITGAQPSSWSNSNGLALTAPTPEGPTGVWTLPIEDDGEAKPFGPTGAQVIAPVFSPDDRWIAYSSQETGRFEIYVGQFPEGPVYRITTDGGMAPVWSRDGRQLFYHWGDGPDAPLRFMAVDIATEPTFTRSRPRLLFEGPYAPCFPVRCYDISPDGKRFILIRRGEQEPQPVTEIDIVVNWFSELNERVRATP